MLKYSKRALTRKQRLVPNFIIIGAVRAGTTSLYAYLISHPNVLESARKKEPKISLIIVGGGPHKKSLLDLIKKLKLEENVKFKGYVSSEEKLRLISESNALVFPSLFEGFGLVILEAFSQKKPALVSKMPPMSDIVSHEKNGYLLDPHDEVEWANAMIQLIENPEKSLTLGAEGRNLLEKSYSTDEMYEKILKMYDDVI